MADSPAPKRPSQQAPHVMDDCEVRCLSCGTPMDDCPTKGPWCCDACRHALPTPPCHDLSENVCPDDPERSCRGGSCEFHGLLRCKIWPRGYSFQRLSENGPSDG